MSLFLFGAGPDVLPMLQIARELGHEVTIIDRRADYARAELLPGATRVVLAKPHEAASCLKPDERTVAVLMNHHFATDRDVLASLLPLNLPYIALLGPKKRTARILEELHTEGHDVDELAGTLHGPAGLDIGAESPEQIALAILAEIQATLSRRSKRPGYLGTTDAMAGHFARVHNFVIFLLSQAVFEGGFPESRACVPRLVSDLLALSQPITGESAVPASPIRQRISPTVSC